MGYDVVVLKYSAIQGLMPEIKRQKIRFSIFEQYQLSRNLKKKNDKDTRVNKNVLNHM